MIHIKSNSIRQKLLNWLLILLIPTLFLGTISAYYLASYFANLAYDSGLFRSVLALADEVEVKSGVMVVDLPDSALNLLEYDIDDDYRHYLILDPNHNVILGEEQLALPKVLPAEGKSTFYDSEFENKKLRMVALNFPLTDVGAKGSAIVVIGESTIKRDKMAGEIVAIMLVPQIILVILIIILVNIGIQRGLISLDRLRALILRRLPTDTRPLEELDAPEELQPLLHAMNELIVKEKSAVNERRHFLANAAHQLKTPLAGLKIQAEAALRESDLASIQHALKQISAGSDNLGRLANQLLSLARAEPEGVAAQTFVSVDLVKLMNEVTSAWVPKALDKNIDLGVECELKELYISANNILLQELLNNLIDNAIRYNQAGAKVTVGLDTINHEAVLSVQDNGLGIAFLEQQKVFERFYRVLGTAESGCGLGLAIVQEIAHQHQARVLLEYSDMKKQTGTTVKVIFRLNEV
ncbi:sensor histidine kinase N-terminal domain-containing protein [Methylotenera sp.]|uniref:sensor histidine kinase n=1 Tax=Methylotenera sp. TaxID=2051956 RepID=UPI00248A1E9E|nr:sensor histidine kinase N-terminal domain-containing protein [Methylotenera sp.]MDI1297716.1 sensor histidine kinase N-terminal domain-containing protein [Methylotenera sp.]